MTPGEYEHFLHDTEVRLARVKGLYEQFFQGFERLEPSVARKELDRAMEVLRKNQPRNTALRFRTQMLVAKYGTYQAYWQRIARQIEEGTFRRDVVKAQQRRLRDQARSKSAGEKEGPASWELDVDVELEPVESASLAWDESDVDAILGSLGPKVESVPPPRRSLSPFGAAGTGVRSTPPEAAATGDPGGGLGATPKPATATFGKPATATFGKPGTATFSKPSVGGASTASPLPASKQAMQAGATPAAMPSAATPSTATPSAATPSAAKPAATQAMPYPAPSPPARAPGARPPSPPAMPPPGLARPVPAVAPPRPPAPAAALTAPLPRPAPIDAPPPAPRSRPGDGDDAHMRRLYDNYVEAKKKNNERVDNVKYESLATSVQQMMPKLREKHGDRKIDFEIVVQNGKVGLKPKVGG